MQLGILMSISSIYIALCGILLVMLAALTVRQRFKWRVDFGDGGKEELSRYIRAHGNAVEYIPIALLLLVAVENSGVSLSIVHALGMTFVIARLTHALALIRTKSTSLPRALGIFFSWLVVLVSAGIVLVNAIAV